MMLQEYHEMGYWIFSPDQHAALAAVARASGSATAAALRLMAGDLILDGGRLYRDVPEPLVVDDVDPLPRCRCGLPADIDTRLCNLCMIRLDEEAVR